MKIVLAEICSLEMTLGRDTSDTWMWRPLILRLTTDEGITGIGEVGLAYGVGHRGGVGMLRDLVEAFVIGADPLEREVIWHNMQRRSFWGGATGPVINAAMSAVDIALWDIAGKALNLPVWKLLGGRFQTDLRTYASQIQFGWDDDYDPGGPLEQYREAASRAVSQGYDAIKLDPIMLGDDGRAAPPASMQGALDASVVTRARRGMEAVREAVGSDVDIILELHSLTSVTGAMQIAEACADLNLFFIEEPVNYNSSGPAIALRQRLPQVRLTGGERVFTRWGFRDYLEAGAMDMVQPDFCLAGGISEGKKICDMAHVYEVTVQGHVCGSPISQLAAMHIETAIPNFQIHEHHINSTCRDNRLICNEDYQPVGGRLRAPDTPGLGLTLNDDFIATFSDPLRIG